MVRPVQGLIAGVSGLILLVACASTWPTTHYRDRARHYQESGNLERALHYSHLAMQREPEEPRAEELSLHLELLRGLGRQVEADSFADFVQRFEAGEDTDSDATVPTRSECEDLEWRRGRTTRLVREFGTPPAPSPFEIQVLAATYEIDAEGHPSRIRVLRAPHPAAAWVIIDSIARAKIRKSRLARIAPAEFPVPHCAYWDFEAQRARSRLPRTL